MKKLSHFIFLLSLCAFGTSSGSGEYGTAPRAINFLIFVTILYCFVANPFKALYKNRILRISPKLDETQKKLLKGKVRKLGIVKKLEEAKVNVTAVLVMAKKEAEVLIRKIKEETQNEFALLQKHSEEQKDYEFRKMEREVVSLTLKEIFEDLNIVLKQNKIIDIMMERVF